MGCKASSPMNPPTSCSIDEIIPSKEPQSLDTSLFITTGMLGVGGFGRVFAGTCLRNNQWYAIKEIKKVSVLRSVIHLINWTLSSE